MRNDFCEYLKFETILGKSIFFKTAFLDLKTVCTWCDTYNCGDLPHTKFRFYLIVFQLNSDSLSECCIGISRNAFKTRARAKKKCSLFFCKSTLLPMGIKAPRLWFLKHISIRQSHALSWPTFTLEWICDDYFWYIGLLLRINWMTYSYLLTVWCTVKWHKTGYSLTLPWHNSFSPPLTNKSNVILLGL